MALGVITLNDLHIIMAQFADDTHFFLDTKESLQETIQVLEDMETSIGLRVNYNKSTIYAIANAKPFYCEKPIVWDPGGVNILGVEMLNTSEQNYQLIIDKA